MYVEIVFQYIFEFANENNLPISLGDEDDFTDPIQVAAVKESICVPLLSSSLQQRQVTTTE